MTSNHFPTPSGSRLISAIFVCLIATFTGLFILAARAIFTTLPTAWFALLIALVAMVEITLGLAVGRLFRQPPF